MRAKAGADRRLGWWLPFFVLVAVVELRGTYRLVMAGDPYSAGDWLINYSAGFVRRGLPGEGILWLASWQHLPLLELIFGLQATCLLIYLGFACRLAVRSRGFAMAAMILSPAAVTFELLNPAEGLRKEVLLFAVVAVLAGAELMERTRALYLGMLLTVVCAGLVLSHESLAVYLPYVFAALWLRRGKEAFRIAIAPALASVVAGVAVLRHPGDAGVAAAVCRSVGGLYAGFGQGACGGSIAWLAVSLGEAHRRTLELAGTYHFGLVYGLLGTLALVPVVLVARALRRSELRLIGGCAMVAGLGSAALFWSGVDWGRWVHIHVMCLTLLLMSMPAREEARSRWWGVAVGAYATCWLLPVTIMSATWPKFGLAGVLLRGLLKI